MSVTELEEIALRIAQLVTDAVEYNKPRHLILAEIEDFSNELLDERDNIIAQMERELFDDRQFLSTF